jgi:uncharacterized damage-inducible protein DinB
MPAWRPDAPLNSIGTLLYHIALVEADWLLEDIQGREYPDWLHHLLQHEAEHRSHIAWLRDAYSR